MRIAQLLSPVHSLGPGERVCLWTQGCAKNCRGCISPEMQEHKGKDMAEDVLSKILISAAVLGKCSGLTVSGGDPFEQSDSLYKLLAYVRDFFGDILVYTGFCIDEIKNGAAGSSGIKCLDYIDVLIDGRYIDERNFHDTVLRGSDNQKIHYLNENVRAVYEEYMNGGRIIETFAHNDTVILTGIMDRREFYE